MPVSLADEVRGTQFGDQRLDKRLDKIVGELGEQPNLSIPAATRTRAEMEAAQISKSRVPGQWTPRRVGERSSIHSRRLT